MTRHKKRIALFTLLIFAMTLLIPVAAQAATPTVAFEPVNAGDSTITVRLSGIGGTDSIRFSGPGDSTLTEETTIPANATSQSASLRYPAKAGEKYTAVVTYDKITQTPKTVTASVIVGGGSVPSDPSASVSVNGTPRDGDTELSVTLRNVQNGDTLTVRQGNTILKTEPISFNAANRTFNVQLNRALVAGRAHSVEILDASTGKAHKVPFTVQPAVTGKATVQFKNALYIGDTDVRVHFENAKVNDRLELRRPNATTLQRTLTSADVDRKYVDFSTTVISGTYTAWITGGNTDSRRAQASNRDFVADASRIDADFSKDPYDLREDVPISIYLNDVYGRWVPDASAWVYVWAEEVNSSKVSPALYDHRGTNDRGVVALRVTNGQLVDYPLRFDTSGRYIFKAALHSPHSVSNPTLFDSNTSGSKYITVGSPGYTGYKMDLSYNGITQRDLRDGEKASRAMTVTPKATGTLVQLTLLNRNGNPVENARVNLSTDSSRIWLDRNSEVTDDDGRIEFRVSGDTRGSYQVTLRTDSMRAYIPVDVTDVPSTPVHAIDLSFEGTTVKNLKAGERADRSVSVITRSNGTPVNLTAYDKNGHVVGGGQRFTISTNSRDIWVDNTAINTDNRGRIDFRVYGDTIGDYEVILRSGDNTYRLPVQVRLAPPGTLVQSALLTINNNTIITNNTIKDIDTAPVIRSDRTFIPYRAVAEAFGAQVVWNENSRQVTVQDRGKTIVMTIGSNTYTVNGVSHQMDVAPYIENSRTMVPVRFIAEAMDFTVNVTYNNDGTTNQVLFTR